MLPGICPNRYYTTTGESTSQTSIFRYKIYYKFLRGFCGEHKSFCFSFSPALMVLPDKLYKGLMAVRQQFHNVGECGSPHVKALLGNH